jgi:hypothetical protein
MANKPFPLNRKPFSLDPFMSADEKADTIGKEVQLIGEGITELVAAIQSLVLSQPGGGLIPQGATLGRVEEISLRWEVAGIFTPVPALARVEMSDSRSWPFLIIKALRHWPAGCMGLVDMRLSADNSSFLPAKGFVALDDALVPTELTSNPIYVKAGSPVSLLIENTDAGFAHGPSATLTIVEVKLR